MKISELSSQYDLTVDGNMSRTKPWEEVVNDDIQGGLSGAGWGGAVGGVWGAVCGGLAFGGCNSFLDYVALGAGSGSGLVNPLVNYNSNNSLEYLGQLHNQGIVAGYDSSRTFYNTNGDLDSSKVETILLPSSRNNIRSPATLIQTCIRVC